MLGIVIKNGQVLRIIIILIISVTYSYVIAQEPIRYTTKQGLPSNHVYDIRQDSEGFMWFATNRGVAKFDGTSFKTFTTKDGLPNNDIWLLEPNNLGRVWCISKSKYQGYIQNDKVHMFITQDSAVITPSVHKSDDKIWLHGDTGTNGIAIYTLKDSALIKTYGWPYFLKEDEKIREKYDLDKKTLACFFDIEKKRVIYFDHQKKVAVDFEHNFISEESINKNLPIGRYSITRGLRSGILPNRTYYFSSDEGVTFIDLDSMKMFPFFFKDIHKNINSGVVKCRANNEEIQVSASSHLMVFNYDFKLIRQYSFPEHISNHSSFQDHDGNIWLADFVHGVTCIPHTQISSNYYLKNEAVQKIGRIDDILFAGIQNKGFYSFDDAKNRFTQQTDLKIDGAHGNIYCIKQDKASNTRYLISAARSYGRKEDRFIPIKYSVNSLPQLWFKDLIPHEGLEYAIHSLGIYVNEVASGNAHWTVKKSGLLQFEIFNEELFVAGSDGLYRYLNDTLIKPSVEHPMLHISITDMADGGTRLIVGTDGRGIYFYDEEKVVHLPSTDGLIVQKVIIQNESTLWLATQEGVKKVSIDTLYPAQSKITDAYYDSDGLIQDNTNDIYLQDSILYAASDQGLARLNLYDPNYRQEPRLFFSALNDTMTYSYEESGFISTSFSVLDYTNQEHYTYAYRLLPSQKKWTSTSTKTLNFSNLPPDHYTLEIIATDQHNNQSVKRQYIHILPAWWQMMWAKMGFVILASTVLAGLYFLLKNRIQKSEEIKTNREKKIAGLELQALRSQMNPHFVHNSLNAIQYFIQRNEVELSEHYLVKFSKLVRLFFEYSRKQTISIKDEAALLNNYLEIEKLRFEDKLNYEIKIDESIEEEEQLIPSMILQPIVENAVNHGLFHKTTKGKVSITFKHIDVTTFMVEVLDNGIGIKKAKELYKNSSKNYQSRSSAVLEERLELLEKNRAWNITYVVEDLADKGNETGTLVKLTFEQPDPNIV